MRLRARLTTLATLGCASLGNAACSSSTDSTPTPPATLTHPVGNISTTLPLPGNPHGLVVGSDGTMLVTRIDSSDVVIGRTPDFALGPSVKVGSDPVDVAVTPDGRTAFVVLANEGRVIIVDVRAAKVVDTLRVYSWPRRVLVTPDGNHLYITTSGGLSDSLAPVYDYDAHTHARLDSVLVHPNTNGITYDAVRHRLYTSSEGWVAEIDATSDVVLRELQVSHQTQDIAVSTDGAELWVATQGQGGVQVYNLTTGAFQLAIPTTSGAFGLARTPDGAQFYATRPDSSLCAIIDTKTHQIVKSFTTGYYPVRVAFDAAGARAVITDGDAGVVLIQ